MKPWHERVLVALAIILLLTPHAVSLTNTQLFTSGSHITAGPNGPEIKLTTNTDLESGNWAPNTSAVEISSNQGNATFVSSGYTHADVDPTELEGAYTNVSNLDVDGANLTIAPPDKHNVGVGGEVQEIRFKDVEVNDSETDLIYTGSSGDSTIILRNASAGERYGLLDEQTDEYLDADRADANGELEFTELPDGTHTTAVEPIGSLEIRNESAPTELVDNATVELRFFYGEGTSSPTIIERNSTNGTIDMTGLPADEDFVVVADADGFVQRRIYVPSLLETQEVFLLPENETFVEQIFELEDFTGLYPKEDSVLFLQRGLNGTYRTVEGDYFGATNSFNARLKKEARHRLVVRNTVTGNEKILGNHVPIANITKQVTILTSGDVEIEDVGAFVDYSPSVGAIPAKGKANFSIEIGPQQEDLAEYNMTVTLKNETGAYVLDRINGTDPDGATLSSTQNLTNETGSRVWVNISWGTAEGRTGLETNEYRVIEWFPGSYSLISALGVLKGLVPAANWSVFSTMFALIITVVITGAVGAELRLSTEVLGLVALLVLAGFAGYGFVGYDLVFAGGAVWVGVAALRRGL